jgi:hypothetical protein
MPKHILLKFERGGEVKATLLEDKAPKTCKALLSSLPVELKLIHAQWAGEEVFSDSFPLSCELEVENEANEMKGGEVGLISPLVLYHRPWKEFVPFCIFYGKGRARKSVDETVEVNICAKIDDLEKMASIGKRIRAQGIETVWITAEEH